MFKVGLKQFLYTYALVHRYASLYLIFERSLDKITGCIMRTWCSFSEDDSVPLEELGIECF